EGSSVGSELVQRMRRQRANGDGQASPAAVPRTVAELRRRGKEVAVERRRKAAVEAARRKAERERAAAQARTVHLDQLVGKEPALWASVMSLITTMKPKSYDQAVALLTDLRDLAARNHEAGFPARVEALRAAHGGKRAFIGRLDEAGL